MIFNKKAQVQSQIFIYVFAVIVVSLILIFGIKAIYSFQNDTEKVALVNFQSELKSIAADAAAQYGSIQKADILLPTEFKQVCFVDGSTNADTISNPLIKNSVESDTSDNIYMIKEINDVEEFRTQTNITISHESADNPLCINNTKGRIVFTIKGMGRYAEVSP